MTHATHPAQPVTGQAVLNVNLVLQLIIYSAQHAVHIVHPDITQMILWHYVLNALLPAINVLLPALFALVVLKGIIWLELCVVHVFLIVCFVRMR